jgi:tetraacyldisaccharide 4'-kinase
MLTEIRNLLYDKQLKKSASFDLPIINVGNLSVGGTGKTPQIEYLIRLLQNDYKIAVISRGYKRKSKGFIVADKQSTAEQIGDEPFQIYQKFPNLVVAVCASRVEAAQKLLQKHKIDLILLDDALQHRGIKAGLNILLTSYNQLFTNDYILPVGNLRECRYQAKRADMVLVTKSPFELNTQAATDIKKKVRKYFEKDIYFSTIAYDHNVFSEKNQMQLQDLKQYSLLLVTGIANPQAIYSFLSEKNINFEALKFSDHHHFSKTDLQRITKQFQQIKSDKKIVLTTEKDYVRLHHLVDFPLYYLPIQTQIFEKEAFNNKILDYVRKEKRV